MAEPPAASLTCEVCVEHRTQCNALRLLFEGWLTQSLDEPAHTSLVDPALHGIVVRARHIAEQLRPSPDASCCAGSSVVAAQCRLLGVWLQAAIAHLTAGPVAHATADIQAQIPLYNAWARETAWRLVSAEGDWSQVPLTPQEVAAASRARDDAVMRTAPSSLPPL